MKHQEFIMTAADKQELFAQSWAPDTPTGLVCLVHGFGEHSGRYTHVAQAMVKADYAVIAFDQRGHGRTAGKQGFTPSYNLSLHDIDKLISEGQKRFPHLPTFLYGHSMGGGMVLNYTLRYKPKLQGVIATSPWLRLTTPPPAAVTGIARLIGSVWKGFTITGKHENGILSRDPAVDEAHIADPLTHSAISAALFFGANDGGAWVLSQAADFPLPLLLMHGDADKLTSFAASQEFAQNAPAATTTFKAWLGYYHETHNDIGKEEVIATIISWMNEQL
ncbi:MAG: lysophospholipase [Anaerolineales bacterium]|nr:lysophospholipase [Anaerolineales bacterium]